MNWLQELLYRWGFHIPFMIVGGIFGGITCMYFPGNNLVFYVLVGIGCGFLFASVIVSQPYGE